MKKNDESWRTKNEKWEMKKDYWKRRWGDKLKNRMERGEIIPCPKCHGNGKIESFTVKNELEWDDEKGEYVVVRALYSHYESGEEPDCDRCNNYWGYIEI